MYLYLENVDYNYIYIYDKYNSKNKKIIYSTPNYTLNGLYIRINYILSFNKVIIKIPEKIRNLEKHIIDKINNKKMAYKPIDNNISFNLNQNINKIIMIISGIWEINLTCGLIYKFVFI
jgi:hypothetical protein